MEEQLQYYYGIKISKIDNIKENYYMFREKNINYIFFEYNGDINELNKSIQFSNKLEAIGIYSNKIIKNKFDKYLSDINGNTYLLMASYNYLDRPLMFSDVIIFEKYNITSKKTHQWNDLWAIKMNYYKIQIEKYKNKYPVLEKTFSYFYEYVNMGIILLNEYIIDLDKNFWYLSHKRIKNDYKLYDLYNPLNMIIDYQVRDPCEYFKLFLFDDNKIFEKIVNYLSVNNLKNVDKQIFFVRMLYPTFYFDEFEKIMNSKCVDKNSINKIKKDAMIYENIIKKLYKYLYSLNLLPIIEWLNQ